jgi:hypothetical protein
MREGEREGALRRLHRGNRHHTYVAPCTQAVVYRHLLGSLAHSCSWPKPLTNSISETVRGGCDGLAATATLGLSVSSYSPIHPPKSPPRAPACHGFTGTATSTAIGCHGTTTSTMLTHHTATEEVSLRAACMPQVRSHLGRRSAAVAPREADTVVGVAVVGGHPRRFRPHQRERRACGPGARGAVAGRGAGESGRAGPALRPTRRCRRRPGRGGGGGWRAPLGRSRGTLCRGAR